MRFELDQYFTPPSIARKILEVSGINSPNSCLDTTCGMGNLLHAARDVFGVTKCIGIDKDRVIISKLRKSNPDWVLSTADLMLPKSYNRAKVVSQIDVCDLLTLNPPFSQSNKKFVMVSYEGISLKCSVAMAYILKSLELFNPQLGALIITPESLMFSHLDAFARLQIEKKFTSTTLLELDESSFSGTRARTIVIKLEPRKVPFKFSESPPIILNSYISTQVIRGSLPVHELACSLRGHSFVHTTNFATIFRGKDFSSLKKTEQCRKGIVKGWLILLPRVGIFHKEYLKSTFFSKPIQLSDCVIALKFESRLLAQEAEKRMKKDLSSLSLLYRGTGARYITVTRIKSWLLDRGIIGSI